VKRHSIGYDAGSEKNIDRKLNDPPHNPGLKGSIHEELQSDVLSLSSQGNHPDLMVVFPQSPGLHSLGRTVQITSAYG
jgi:hypothetical protein